MGNGLSKLLDFRGQTIDVSDQSVFILKYSGLNDEEGKKNNISDPITAARRRSCSFLSFMMMVHTDQDDPNLNYSRMNCRACVQLPLYLDAIDAKINTQILKTLHDILAHLAALYNGRKPDIVTLNKDKRNIF